MGVWEGRGESNIAREVDYRAPKARVRGVGDPYRQTALADAAKLLVENKEGKTPKKLKIAMSRSNIKNFENETECDDLLSRGSLIQKISPLSQKLLPTRPILWPISIFQQNRK